MNSSAQKNADAIAMNPNVKEIIVIIKTHFDIGYTHRVKDIIHYYQTGMIDTAIRTSIGP